MPGAAAEMSEATRDNDEGEVAFGEVSLTAGGSSLGSVGGDEVGYIMEPNGVPSMLGSSSTSNSDTSSSSGSSEDVTNKRTAVSGFLSYRIL
jgi:hypothetical protein